MNLLSIRNIDTLKVIGTIGPRLANMRSVGDNLNEVPEVGDRITIQGRQFAGLDPKNSFAPKFIYPDPKYYKVVAVTSGGAYVTKWKEEETKPFSLERFFGGRR